MRFYMAENDNPQTPSSTRKVAVAIPITLVLLFVLVFTQLISAAQDEGTATPPPQTFMEESDFSDFAPTTQELLTMSPSIERYIAAHSLPAGVLQAANLATSTKSVSKEIVLLTRTSLASSSHEGR